MSTPWATIRSSSAPMPASSGTPKRRTWTPRSGPCLGVSTPGSGEGGICGTGPARDFRSGGGGGGGGDAGLGSIPARWNMVGGGTSTATGVSKREKDGRDPGGSSAARETSIRGAGGWGTARGSRTALRGASGSMRSRRFLREAVSSETVIAAGGIFGSIGCSDEDTRGRGSTLDRSSKEVDPGRGRKVSLRCGGGSSTLTSTEASALGGGRNQVFFERSSGCCQACTGARTRIRDRGGCSGRKLG